MKRYLLLLILLSCNKQEPTISDTACIVCTKKQVVIDTCGQIQDINTWMLDMKADGYKCQTQ